MNGSAVIAGLPGLSDLGRIDDEEPKELSNHDDKIARLSLDKFKIIASLLPAILTTAMGSFILYRCITNLTNSVADEDAEVIRGDVDTFNATVINLVSSAMSYISNTKNFLMEAQDCCGKFNSLVQEGVMKVAVIMREMNEAKNFGCEDIAIARDLFYQIHKELLVAKRSCYGSIDNVTIASKDVDAIDLFGKSSVSNATIQAASMFTSAGVQSRIFWGLYGGVIGKTTGMVVSLVIPLFRKICKRKIKQECTD